MPNKKHENVWKLHKFFIILQNLKQRYTNLSYEIYTVTL